MFHDGTGEVLFEKKQKKQTQAGWLTLKSQKSISAHKVLPINYCVFNFVFFCFVFRFFLALFRLLLETA